VELINLNPKRILAVILLIVVAIMIIYPPLSKGTVSVRLSEKALGPADHLYVTVSQIKIHDAGVDNQTGWHTISNNTVTLDLMNSQSMTDFVAKGTLASGWYDMVSIRIDSASLVSGSNKTSLGLPSDQFNANVSLLIKTLSASTLTVQVTFNTAEMMHTGILNLKLEAIAT
jgi:hypothetical protein